jgi:hypothetical protein
MKSRARKLLTAAIGVGSVSYVVGCSDDAEGGLTSGNLVAPPYYSGAGTAATDETGPTSRETTTDDSNTTGEVDETSTPTDTRDGSTPDAHIPDGGANDATTPDANLGTADSALEDSGAQSRVDAASDSAAPPADAAEVHGDGG